MAYFIPSSIQKRLLRYALSRLELLDTDALDLESLDIAWSKRSTVELKDISFRISKLRSLLHLPDQIELKSAKIARVRVTVPADIYTSSILIELEGIYAHLCLPVQHSSNVPDDKNGLHKEHRGSRMFRSSSSTKPSPEMSATDQETSNYIPTAQDLAASFLLEEPSEERRELEAALTSQSQKLQQSVHSVTSSEEEANTGLGTALGLPAFLAGFLKGIADRLEVQIRDVTLSVDVIVQQEGVSSQNAIRQTSTITLKLSISSLNVHPCGIEGEVTSSGHAPGVDSNEKHAMDAKLRAGKRCISLKEVHGYLIYDPTLIDSNHGGFGGHLKHEDSPPDSPILRRSYRSQSRNMNGSQNDGESELMQRTGLDHLVNEGVSSGNLQESNLLSEGGRFSDATEDELLESEAELLQEDDSSINAWEGSRLHSTLIESQTLEYSSSFPPNMRQSLQEFRAERRKSTSIGYSAVSNSFPLPKSDIAATSGNWTLKSEKSSDGARTPTLPEHSMSSVPDQASSRQEKSSQIDDLLESREFTQEEARSLYMSAMAEQDTEPFHSNPPLQVQDQQHEATKILPWNNPNTSSPPESQSRNLAHDTASTSLPEIERPLPDHPLETAELSPQDSHVSFLQVEDQNFSRPSYAEGNNILEHTLTSMKHSPATPEITNLVTTRILTIDAVDVWLPSMNHTGMHEESSFGQTDDQITDRNSFANQSQYRQIPGAFSEFAERSRPDIRKTTLSDTDFSRSPSSPISRLDQESNESEILFSSVQTQIDIMNIQAFTRLAQQLFNLIENKPARSKDKDACADEGNNASNFQMKLSLRKFSVSFFESLRVGLPNSSRQLQGSNKVRASSVICTEKPLFEIITNNLSFQLNAEGSSLAAKLEITKFTVGFSDRPILSFSRDTSMRVSLRDLQELRTGHDINIQITRSVDVSDISIFTLPVKLDIDIQKLDEALSCFGGFSGLLELGNSINSSGPAFAGKTPITAKPRNVRFESSNEPAEIENIPAKFKMQSRIGGAHITLQGKDCSIVYQSTAIKVVGRDALFRARIDHAQIRGPFASETRSQPSIDLQLHDIALKYLLLPEEQDLAKLLSLITPSKDKFEEDDDILLGTLLQQRKKGSVLRAAVSNIELLINDSESIGVLKNLSTELSKLSSVAKYLPEDDRPGLMTLGSIGKFKIQVYTTGNAGILDFDVRKAELGHVGLPPLLALSVHSLAAYRHPGQTMLHQVLEQHRQDCPPMIMARIIGDEMEPTVKIKLYNLCFEYSVPLIVALLDLSPDSRAEEKVVHVANSIAHLAYSASVSETNTEVAPNLSESKQLSKPLVLDIAIRDCAIGLTPQKSTAKGMVVLTEVHFSGTLPTDTELDMMLAIRKASCLIINDIDNASPENVKNPISRPTKSSVGSVQIMELCRQGFVTVAFISAAKLFFKQTRDSAKNAFPIDVDFRDALLVLETCADSTETFSKILEGLSLPSPPSTGQEFRADVGPIEDLMASVLIDAFGDDQDNQQVVSDQETSPDFLQQDEDEYDDELTADSEVLNAFARDQSTHLLDPLMDSILFNHSQRKSFRAHKESISYRTGVGTDLVDTFEVLRPDLAHENLQIQPMSASCSGTAHKWNSSQNKYLPVEIIDISDCPLKIKVRGLHVIWNLFDGYDWEETRDAIAEAVKGLEAKASEKRANRRRSLLDEHDDESVIGDFLFNSIYIGIPMNRDDHDLRRRINANVDDLESEAGSYVSSSTARQANSLQPKRQKLKLARSKRHKITFELRRVSADIYMFKPGGETQSSIDVSVGDLEVFDHVPTSTWKKFATYMHDAGTREESKPMIHLEICHVRPAPELTATELVVKVSVLPLRLHVDQDALDFITRFFEFSDSKSELTTTSDNEPYLQRVEVEAVQLKLDYKPKKVDYAGLRSGHTTEFMNFFILDGADIVLKHTIIYGVRGFTRLHKDLDGVWMPDIKRNQLPRILSGLTGVRSLVDVGLGIRDMIEIPIQEYRKDGRIMKSIQKGAAAFGKTTSELTRLGAKLATGAQTTLQGAEELFVRPDLFNDAGWEIADLEEGEKRVTSNYADQPAGIMQGLKGAAEGLRREALLTRDTIVAMSSGIRESTSASGAAGAIAKHAPTIIFRPVIGASKAVSQTLMGATNSLDPENRRRFEDKYKKY